jgi:hypothetical protein
MSSRPVAAKDLEADCRDLIRVQESNLGFEVQVPVIYPNGDFATVVVAHHGAEYLVHDAGFAAMTLSSHGVKITPNLKTRIAKLSEHYGCEFLKERMSRTAKASELPLAIAVVANASRTIADQLLQVSAQPVLSFRQSVINRVKEFVGPNRVRENELVVGNSGTEYHVGAAVLDPKLEKPVAYVEAVRDMEGVNKRFREFYDISLVPELSDMTCIVLYDDTADLRQGDLLVLQNVSNVVRFSDAETRLKQLRVGNE